MSQPKGLAMSADKKDLFRRLGLTDPMHKKLLEEASRGRDRLSNNPANLAPGVQARSMPYKWDEISETARHREILSIVQNADLQTRPYYAAGHEAADSTTGNAGGNWVARWYLWHSFRYRDNKERGRATASNSSSVFGGTGTNYDPVHGTFR